MEPINKRTLRQKLKACKRSPLSLVLFLLVMDDINDSYNRHSAFSNRVYRN